MELVLLEGFGEVLNQLLGKEVLLMQMAVIQADGFVKVAANGVRSHLGPVKAALDVNALVDVGIDPHAQAHTVGRVAVILKEAGGDVLHDVLIVLPVRAVDHEGVCFPAADDSAGITDHLTGLLTDAPEDLVSVCLAVTLVDHVEVVDIQDDRVGLHVRMALIKLLGVAIEEFLVEKAGELVPFGGLDNVPVFRELDNPENTGEDNVDRRVGLRNKIDCAELQAFQLGRLLRGGDDDGDVLELLVRFGAFQDLITRHDRHEQIQQNQGQSVLPFAHQTERFRTVRSAEHLIIIAQIVPENLAVDQFVVNNQNASPPAVRAQRLMQVWHLILLPK